MCNQLKFLLPLIIFIIIFITLNKAQATGKKSKLINEHVYSNLFTRHREEQKTLLNHIRGIEDYAKQYKLLQVGLLKILDVIADNREALKKEQYLPSHGFPSTEITIDSVVLILENTCLFGDFVLHLPEMSNKILAKVPTWHEQLNWAITFAQHFMDSVFDENARQLISLFDQQINPNKRTQDFINPYLSKNTKEKKEKKRRKIRKGPQLSTGHHRQEL